MQIPHNAGGDVRRMEIEILRSFVEVYNCRSITKAANNIFIAQPTLSRRIQALEKELGVQLFTRSGTAVIPTEAATALYKEAQKILQQHDTAVLNMSKFKSGVGGSLRIGIMCALAISPTAHAVSLMQKQYPDVEMIFDCDKNTNVPYRLANGEIDVGITTYGETLGIDAFACEVIKGNTLAVIIGRNHRLWKKQPIYVEDINGETLYDFNPSVAYSRTAVLELFRKHHVALSNMVPCRSIEEVLLNVACGKGISTAGMISNEQYFSMRDIINVVPLEGTLMDQGYASAIYDKDKPLACKFVEILKDCW